MQYKTKQDLRERILSLLRNQKEEERLAKSLIIGEKLFQLPEFKTASVILFYAPFDGEVHTFEMIKQAQQQGKQTSLPKVIQKEKKIVPTLVHNLEEELQEGSYGILEPKESLDKVAPQELDMVVVPALAYDSENFRLGRGGGYYDRFLKTLPSDTPTVGLAYDFQMVDTIPQKEDHDMPVMQVLTN